jgi:hypothetical protein
MRDLQNMIVLGVGKSVLGSCKVLECLSPEVNIIPHLGQLRLCCTYECAGRILILYTIYFIPGFKILEHFIRLW